MDSTFTRQQLEAAFADACRRRAEARKELEAAQERERAAGEELAAIQTLARVRFHVELSQSSRRPAARERAPAGPRPVEEPRAEGSRPQTAAELMRAYFERWPEPATPAEVAAGIARELGKKISSTNVGIARDRHADAFEKVEVAGKRGAFRLKLEPQPARLAKSQG